MKLQSIPRDYIINMVSMEHGQVESNFLLHGLSIHNDTDQEIELQGINFGLYSSNQCIKQVSYLGREFEFVVDRFAKECGWLGEGFGAKLFLGEEGFYQPGRFSNSRILKPNEETGIFNEYFVIVYKESLDRLQVIVRYQMEGIQQEEELNIPLIQYKNRNEYIFPLRGRISTCGNYNALLDHRQHFSMEFAIDMAQYNEEQKLCFKEDMKQEDYVVFGKDILSIADGEVVDCFNTFPVTSSWIWEERKPLLDKYGLASQCGNYVAIKHAGGEYSFYGHMVMGSVTVAVGDKVKQGQVIGKVGHTGLSNCPHLHFQLMDGPDFLTARGLPCSFTNIKDVTGDSIGLIQENNMIIHAE
ncbi:MAG TPA: M23 family metallopeptidase [Lachnospiraceae bacterium]|nr:M23 family metallopeptidase [Lachnospiraceae bacterium]